MNATSSVSVRLRKNTLFSVAVVSAPVALLGGRAHAETNAMLTVRELLAGASEGVWRYQIFNNTPSNGYVPEAHDFVTITVQPSELFGLSDTMWISHTTEGMFTNRDTIFTYVYDDFTVTITNPLYAVKPAHAAPHVTNELVILTRPGLPSATTENAMHVGTRGGSLYYGDMTLLFLKRFP